MNTLFGNQVGILFFVVALILIALSNSQTMRGLRQYPTLNHYPRASILVPFRHEESNVEPCVRSLLAQDYPDFEVLVLCDDETDGTATILDSLSSKDHRLTLVKNTPMPGGWIGKHWACVQLAAAADGELLLFTDADTRHHPLSLRDSVKALAALNVDLLSVMPRQVVISWAEKLAVPVIPWAVLSFFPLALAYRLRVPWLSIANGQFMLFRSQAYHRIGGHASVKQNIADDLVLCRRVVVSGFRFALLDGNGRVDCRMYHGSREVVAGFSKNLFAAFGYRVIPFLFVWLWVGMVFIEPLILLSLVLAGFALPTFFPSLAVATVSCSLILWSVAMRRSRLPTYLALCYPIITLMAVGLSLRSLALTLAGRVVWKGRLLPRTEATWF